MKQVAPLVLVFIIFFHAPPAMAQVLFVTSEYEPYVINQDGVAKGIFPDIVKAIFSELNIEVNFKFQPWKRGENTMKMGKAYATFPYLINEQRAEVFDFSDSVIYFFPKFFYKKERFPNGFEWSSLKDFQRYNIGGVIGYWYEKSFQKADLKVQYVTTDMQNIHKLMMDRIDFTLIDELVGWILINKAYPEHVAAFTVARKPESCDAFHLMVSRKYSNAKELTKKFNKGLKVIKDNGTYQKILRNYRVPIEYETP
jgi:polar amino acid transport system substrate-binding protein